MYTIFVNESVIYLAEKPIENLASEAVKYNEKTVIAIIEKVKKGLLKAVCIYADNIDELWIEFKNLFTVIEAAGGVVFNERNEVLWIYRYDRWDLPKGKVETGESLKAAALREVEEECGVTNLEIVCPIIKTYHIYQHKGSSVLKISHWFKMYASSQQDLQPQLEENITKVMWINIAKIDEVLKKSYDNIKLLCKFAIPQK